MKIAIGIAATGKYCYALKAQAEKLLSALLTCPEHEYIVLLIGNKQSQKYFKDYIAELTTLAKVLTFNEEIDDNKKNYGAEAQMIIAQLQGRLFHEARKLNVDLFWSLEADVLPPANALRVMVDALKFDNGYYDISFCPYPSQGGGGFLGGFGTIYNQIAEDALPHERNIPDELKAKWDLSEKENKDFIAKKEKPSDEWIKSRQELEKQIKECSPKTNIWHLQGDGYRRRGWLDNAMPGIGKGAIVQCDWVGLGCTMLSKRALSLAHFEGYQGQGTQDLFLIWHKWYPEGLRLCVIPHAPSSHVIRDRQKDGTQSTDKLFLANAFHETEGECKGHLRIKTVPFEFKYKD